MIEKSLLKTKEREFVNCDGKGGLSENPLWKLHKGKALTCIYVTDGSVKMWGSLDFV